MTPYVPALAFRALTPLYDLVLPWFFDELALKRQLVGLASIAEGDRILDLGCGTGTLLAIVRSRQSACRAVGIDADPAMLARAKRKLGGTAGVVAGMAERLPFPPCSFDHVLSSLFFHHVPSAAKPAVLRAAFEVVRPGGQMHVLDFGPPSTRPRAAVFGVLRLFDGIDPTRDNVRGLLPQRIREAGFVAVREVSRRDTMIGTVCYWQARRPAASGGPAPELPATV